MSMDRCEVCGRGIDTDDDPDCYRDRKNPKLPWENYREDNIVMCEGCRDNAEIWDE